MLTPSPASDSTIAWDQYWRDGRLASCGGEGGVNYQPFIAEGWRRFFESTLSGGMRVLDICSGNGAIACLAAEVASAHDLHLTIYAMDAAEIRPTGLGPGADMIHFSPRIRAENLPLPPAACDVIAGQYAIEYTNLDQTLVELNRVSRPAAHVRFVTHATGSVVVREASRQLADVDRLLQTGIFGAAEAFVRVHGDQPAANARESREAFLLSLQSLREAETGALDHRMYRNVGNVIVDAVQHQPQVGAGPVLDKIVETSSAIHAHAGRLSAMCKAALDVQAAQALTATAERLWSQALTLDPLIRPDGAMFGWVIASAGTPA